jgi:hypothetical protein
MALRGMTMVRIALGVVLGVLALACAPTLRTVQGRSVYHNVSGDVKEVSPGHITGPWKSVGVSIDDVGQKGEDAMSWTETGTIDMVWKSPTELAGRHPQRREHHDWGEYDDLQTGPWREAHLRGHR